MAVPKKKRARSASSAAGRKSKWNQKLQDAIIKLVEAGDRAEVAAGVNGICRSTHFGWMAERDDYRTAVTRARDVFESTSRAVILGGDEKGNAFGPAKAALEVLSRRLPKHWASQVKVEVADQLNRFLDAAERICSQQDFAKLLEALAEESSGAEASGAPVAGSSPVH